MALRYGECVSATKFDTEWDRIVDTQFWSYGDAEQQLVALAIRVEVPQRTQAEINAAGMLEVREVLKKRQATRPQTFARVAGGEMLQAALGGAEQPSNGRLVS